MCPEKARVAMIEDNAAIREMLRTALEFTGHIMVFEADTLPQALEFADKAGEYRADVAIVDGNLQAGSHCEDGILVVEALKKSDPSITTIGYSADCIDLGDVTLRKGEVSIFDIIQLVTDAPARSEYPRSLHFAGTAGELREDTRT